MKKTKLLTLAGTVILAFSMTLTGCSQKIDPDAIAATLDEKEIRLGVASFMAKQQQVSYDAYSSYFGADMWSQDMAGDGTTLKDTVKNDVMDDIEEMYILDNHKDEYKISLTDDDTKKIEQAAKDFVDANSEEALTQMGTTQEDIVEALRLYTVRSKMRAEMIADVDTKVTDKEAAQRTFSYIKIDTTGTTDEEGNTVQYTDEEKADLKNTAQEILENSKSGNTAEAEAALKEQEEATDETSDDTSADTTEDTDPFSIVSKAAGYTVSTYSYGSDELEDEDSTMDDAVIKAADNLKEGKYAKLIETDDAIYVIRLDSEFDEEATETKKQSIVTQRQDDAYNKIYDAWKEDVKFSVNDDVWKTVTFDAPFTRISSDVTPDETTE